MRLFSFFLCALLIPGCPSSEDSGPDGDADVDSDTDSDTDADSDLSAAVYPGEVIGRVHVYEASWGGHSPYARVMVELWDGRQPAAQTLVDQDGDCSVMDGPRIYGWDCDPPCSDEEMCVEDHCEAYPGLAPSGTVTVSGLGTADAVFEPGSDGRYPSSYDWPEDLFAANDPISVTSTGGATPALDMSAWGVEPLEVTVESLVPGQPMRLQWTPPSKDQRSRIQVMLQTGWHGSSSMTTIWCDTEDDGELIVPASLTGQFDIPSCGECESSTIARYTHDTVDFGSGPVQLFVGSEYSFVAWW